jgi:hypothetical protein
VPLSPFLDICSLAEYHQIVIIFVVF